MSVRSLVLAVTTIVSVPAVASAQGTSEPPPHPRQGVFGGFGLHAGNLSCEGDNCNDFFKAGGANAHVGWGFNGKLGLVFDLWGMTAKENDVTISQGFATIGVRYWVVPILWVQGGIGGAQASIKYDGPFGITFEDHTDGAAGVVGAVGIEVIKSKSFALDVQGRIGYGFYGDNDEDGEPDNTGRSASLGVGFTWF
jgi:hypothetical protein